MNDSTSQAAEIPLAPMIDCVFLLLIYFLLSAALLQPEVDHPVNLPAGDSTAVLPDELIIELIAATITINGTSYGNANSAHSRDLRVLLNTLGQLSRNHDQPLPVIILPEPDSSHEAVTRLIALCHASGLSRITFGKH